MNKNLRWKLLTIFGVFVIFFALGVYPILAPRYHLPLPGWLSGQAAQAWARPQGRRAPRPARADRTRRCRRRPRRRPSRSARSCKTANVPVGAINTTSPTALPRRGRAAGSGCGVPPDRRRAGGHQLRPAARRGRRLRLHDEAEHREATCASRRSSRRCETIDRRVNELGVAEPNISRYGQTGDQILVQLPGRVRRRAARRRSSGRRRSSS